VEKSFAEFTLTLDYADLPESVLKTLRRSFYDTLGVAAVGSRTAMSNIAYRCACAVFGPGQDGVARALMLGGSFSPVGAAMVGAFTVDSVDAHDGSTPCRGHAGSAVFPSLLAMADCQKGIDGQHFAAALACAYEVSYRAGLTQHANCADYHTSGHGPLWGLRWPERSFCTAMLSKFATRRALGSITAPEVR